MSRDGISLSAEDIEIRQAVDARFDDDDDDDDGGRCSGAGSVVFSELADDATSTCAEDSDSFNGAVISSSSSLRQPPPPVMEPVPRERRLGVPLRCVFQLPGRRSNVIELLAVRAINGTPAVACASAAAAAVESIQAALPASQHHRVVAAADDANSASDTRLLRGRRQAVADLAEAGGLPTPEPPTGSRLPGYRRRYKPNIGYRLGRRRLVTERRKRLCDYSLVCAAFGLVVMIVETELSMANLYEKVSRCIMKIFYSP